MIRENVWVSSVLGCFRICPGIGCCLCHPLVRNGFGIVQPTIQSSDSPPVAWFFRGKLVYFPGDRFGALREEGNCIFRICVV
jgi:hypothetical protein